MRGASCANCYRSWAGRGEAMSARDPAPDCADEAALLLPWFVNGTLDGTDTRRVAAHLEHCPACRADVARLETVRTLLRSPAQVEYAPQAGLRRLLGRIDEDERRTRQRPLPPGADPAPPRAAPGTRRHRFIRPGALRWLAAATLAQAVAIVAIVAVVASGALRPPATDAPYRTLTAVADEGPRLRAVFAPAMTVAELQELLRANQLVAVAGPSDAGVFTLALRVPTATADVQAAVVTRLRADPRVRFAELQATAAPEQ
jgi:anti-sigma factor RsiW